ncbi:metallophosphoesterase family protein [Metabacillus litoralis]|uniref:metallophosphoesterase family protein n=1 Tax=Metabacillus litoralis TaxID=152268 RepID=UPI001CFCCBDA|nr:metallophosphoesterase [Metabacillus litoralis]
MKVLLISDSHGLTSEVDMIKDRHEEEVELMLHCGDSELLDTNKELSSFRGVKGNCDFGSDLPNEIIEDINGKTLYMTHGHLYNVKMTLMSLKYRAEEVNAKIVCYGHSHIAAAELIDGILFINPGSIRLPLQRRQKTYAIVEVNASHTKVIFYDVNGEEIQELSNEFMI